jgi:hypothetical protein
MLGRKLKQSDFMPRTRKAATQKFRGELERWERIQAARPKLSPEELFMQREGMPRATFDRLTESYFKHAALKPQNISRAPDVLAHDLAKEANVPYIRAHIFVGWANWGLRGKLRPPTKQEIKSEADRQKAP